jgi:hypothetical protein
LEKKMKHILKQLALASVFIILAVGCSSSSDTTDDTDDGTEAEAVPMLVERLGDSESRVAQMAAEALGNIGPRALEALPALAAAAAGPDEYLRRRAAEALAKIDAALGK